MADKHLAAVMTSRDGKATIQQTLQSIYFQQISVTEINVIDDASIVQYRTKREPLLDATPFVS